MITAKGFIDQIYLDERRAARISCPPDLRPGPGQYLLASTRSDPAAPLALPVYTAGNYPGGFYIAAPLALDANWLPGTVLDLRGPLGRGFHLPAQARKVALGAPGGNGARVLALLEPALAQNASVVLCCDQPPADLPAAVEILPASALSEITIWADYLACQVHREDLPGLLNLLTPERSNKPTSTNSISPRSNSAQVLVETSLPCGGLADCCVCAVSLRPGRDFKLACKDGPVFDIY